MQVFNFVMTLANIIRLYILPPHSWSTNTLDTNMILGDHFVGDIRIDAEISMLTHNDSTAYHIPADGYIEVRNIGVSREDFIIYDMNFTMNF